jgi:REP element-mobilizing transposase RayT
VKYGPAIHRRRSIRLQGYDYSQAGAYFVTICTQNRACLFGEIHNGEMQLNDVGMFVADEWVKTADTRNEIELDAWVVMPNHFHGIMVFNTPIVGAIHESPLPGQSPLPMTVAQRRNMALPKLIGRFKMLSAKRINEWRRMEGTRLWQRGYWEHVIRTDESLNQIRQYITHNPAQWQMDSLHPSRVQAGLVQAGLKPAPTN